MQCRGSNWFAVLCLACRFKDGSEHNEVSAAAFCSFGLVLIVG